MADDTNQQGTNDRAQISANQPYEVAYFAKKHGITQKVARELIGEIGNDRDKLDAAAAARTGLRNKTRAASSKATATRTTTSRRGAVAAGPTKGTVAAANEALGAITRSASAKVRRVADAALPLSDAMAPAAQTVTASARTVVSAARRSSAAARKRIAAAPAKVGKRAGKALDATKTAAKSRTAAVLGAAAAGLVAGLAVNLGRKAAVQAPSLMAGDWLEAVKLEHKMALGIFDAIEKTTNSEPAKRTMLLIQLTHALSKHAFTEENVIYPALREWGDKADADKLNHDHGYVKQHLYALDASDPASPDFLAKITTFRADLEAHIQEEETAVFPPLHAALGEAKNARITALANKEGFKLA